ncbi:PGN_0703 family putative restriction endonuclease [Aurantiacibacter aquimixticola]|uniref:Uncharacterized protein n=1 Tax=Aurantiacibacter aquimixticola TaxID=1958945 RepID=A0A419RTL8_9SPHN|nr:hypothetical protein [Aurantiacibacter aquimixticola]RJY09132.1 hypothetical protein D6201_06935 [Aurantiacibacter aquimixticola]
MSEGNPLFLPGVPEDRVRAILERAAGNEIASGKFANPQSSAALAANGFGWFLERPSELPAFPPLADLSGRPVKVGIECEMRFPWSGGRHPWLDAAVWTETHLIGVESKRYEPFRGAKPAELSEAYDRDVWGDGMSRWRAMRDLLRAEPRRYRHLDAAQLVKHALGIATQASREGLEPVLLYLFAEPGGGMEISDGDFLQHRREIEDLQVRVAGDRVGFATCSWRGWLSAISGAAADHARAMQVAFAP